MFSWSETYLEKNEYIKRRIKKYTIPEFFERESASFALQASETRLRTANIALENLVRKRTLALEELNLQLTEELNRRKKEEE